MNHIFVFLFLLSGVCNVVLVKWMNTLLVTCSDGQVRYFHHPMLLTLLMFVGQCLGFIIYKFVYCFLERRGDGSVNMNIITRGERDFTPIKMLPPATLNCIATILFLTGLYLTFVSSFQMIRICTIIFAGIFSAIHLNMTLIGRHLMAMLIIICGIVLIIINDIRRIKWEHFNLAHENTNSILTGDLLIICGCIIEAAKMIYEEKYIKMIDVPVMQAIGWQGLFGTFFTVLATIIMNYIPISLPPFTDNERNVFDNLFDLAAQIQSNKWLIAALTVYIVATLMHSYSSLTIIKFSSTSNLLFADSILRSCLVCFIAMLLQWEQFNIIAVLALFILQSGVTNYRQAFFYQWYRSALIYFTRLRYDHMTDATIDPTIGDPVHGGGGGIIQTTNRPADII